MTDVDDGRCRPDSGHEILRLTERWCWQCRWCTKARSLPECVDACERPADMRVLDDSERERLFAWVRSWLDSRAWESVPVTGETMDTLGHVLGIRTTHACALRDAAMGWT